MREYQIEGEGHTVGCMLRQRLFDEGCTFAACVVKHPEDTHLCIQVESEDPAESIRRAVRRGLSYIDDMLKIVAVDRCNRQALGAYEESE